MNNNRNYRKAVHNSDDSSSEDDDQNSYMEQQQQWQQQQQQQRQKQQRYADEDQSIYGIDLFLRCLYDYWLHGGINFLIARKLTALLKTLTLFVVVVIFFYCIDYAALIELSQMPSLTDASTDVASSSIIHSPDITWASMCWMIGCGAYFLYNAWKTVNQIQQAYNIREFYRVNLNVRDDEGLYWMPWNEVCRRLRKFQYAKWCSEKKQECHQQMAAANNNSPERQHFQAQLFADTPSSSSAAADFGNNNNNNAPADIDACGVAEFRYEAMLSDDNIASMIMRRENYWIALFADNVLAFDRQRDDQNRQAEHVDFDEQQYNNSDTDYDEEYEKQHRAVGDDNDEDDDDNNRAPPQNDSGESQSEFSMAFRHLAPPTSVAKSLFDSDNGESDDDDNDDDQNDNKNRAKKEKAFHNDDYWEEQQQQQTSESTSGRAPLLAAPEMARQKGSRRNRNRARRRRNYRDAYSYDYRAQFDVITAKLNSRWLGLQRFLIKSVVEPLFVTECDEHNSAHTMQKPILTKMLQWCLTYGLFGFAIDSQTGALKHELTLFVEESNTYAERERKRTEQSAMFRSAAQWHRQTVSQPLTNKLIWRFRTMAIVGALLSPFIFVLVLLSFFFEHGDEVRREPGRSLGARQWTNEARWAFRRYNELPHLFEARLARGALAAQRYVNSFLFSTQGEYARCVSFMLAAALSVFLVIGAVGDEEALSLVTFALHRSAFWWITTLSLLVAAARSLVPGYEAVRHETLRRHDNDVAPVIADRGSAASLNDSGYRDACENEPEQFWSSSTSSLDENGAWQYVRRAENFDRFTEEFLPTWTPRQLCATVAHLTGYYPRSWQRREHTEAVRERFFCLYDSKWLIYLREILGIVYTPYLLWFVFPQKAQQFLDFFVDRTERQHKVGHVCARDHTETINASEIV